MQSPIRLSFGKTDIRPRGEGQLPLAALEFESPSAAIVATPAPPLSRRTNLFVFLLVVSALIASAFIRVDKVVSARGKLVAEAPNIVMQPFDQSIVESINVKEGSIVRKGQVLARLNPRSAPRPGGAPAGRGRGHAIRARRVQFARRLAGLDPRPANQ
jgi:HlyD family secretion protein